MRKGIDKNFLGWRIGGWKSEYSVGMPELSKEEEEVVEEVAARFRDCSRHSEIRDKQGVRKQVGRLLASHCVESGLEVDEEQRRYLIRAAVAHVYGFSALDELLSDPELEEIAVIGIGAPIFVYHRKKGWLRTNCAFENEEALVDVINKMGRKVGRRITLQKPRLNAVLPDGSRIHASIPPISSYELTIRKFRCNPIHVADLIAYRTFSAEALAFLWLMMQADASILIAGNTASGKTSTMNALFQFISPKERILITEETPEINIPHEHKVKLLASDEIGVSMKELVADSLRMRPDRVIVGEARTAEEVKALLETMTSGQARGSYATFHAQSARETLVRMRSLGVLSIDLESLGLIVVQRRMMKYDAKSRRSTEIRRCTEIGEMVPCADCSLPKINILFKYDSKQDAVVRSNKKAAVIDRACESFGMSRREFGAELKSREKFLGGLDPESSFEEITEEIRKFSFANYEESIPKPKAKPAGIGFFNSVFE